MILNSRKKHHRVLLLGVSFLMISILLFTYNCYDYFKFTKKEKVKINNFFNAVISKDIATINVSDEIQVGTESNVSEEKDCYDDEMAIEYVLVLEIPSIKLKKGLVELGNKYNNVRYNIQIIEGSDYPNIENGNLILAAHNGSDYYAILEI